MTSELEQIRTGHPGLYSALTVAAYAGCVLTVALTLLANLTLPADLARANPRFASLIVFARKVAPVLRGVIKPLAGIFLPRYAAEVVRELLGDDAPSSTSPVSLPPPSGGRGGRGGSS